MCTYPQKISALVLSLCAALVGCEQPPEPYVPKSSTAPAVVYCNDNTGYRPGAKPIVMGGTCCCTPNDELMERLHRDGHCVGMTAEDLAQQYRQAGFALKGPGHQRCNGLCPQGPHATLGGKCLCPPTPGTDYYEKVIVGTNLPVK